MQKGILFVSLLLLGGLASCGSSPDVSPAKLDFGTKEWVGAEISTRSHLNFVKRSKFDQLISDKASFILLVHGAADTCTCYTEFHDNCLAPYVRYHDALIYAIELGEFETGTEYYGVERIVGVETIAIFRDGRLAFQKTNQDETDPWCYQYADFNNWMSERAIDAKLFYVSMGYLDSFYAGTEDFTVYFGLENCPDCRYLNRTAVRSYLRGHDIVEENFFYFDMAPYWSTEDGTRQATMAKYGLSDADPDNPVAFDRGYVPTIFYVHPDGNSFYGDGLIEASGCFYNESIEDGKIAHTYFTQERLEAGNDTFMAYLSESNVANKVIEGIEVGIVEKSKKHDTLAVYEEPILTALLDYAIGPGPR